MCKRPVLVWPCCKVAVTSRGLHAFHTSPPACFPCRCSWPIQDSCHTLASLSGLTSLGCWSPGCQHNALSYSVHFIAKPFSLLECSCHHLVPLQLPDDQVNPSVLSLSCHALSGSFHGSFAVTSDRTFQDPKCQTGERFRPALCAFIGRSLTRESCRFSAGKRAGYGRSGDINRRPVLALILLLARFRQGA